MKLYALLINYRYEGDVLIGIYSTENNAQKAWDNSPWKNFNQYKIREVNLDSSPDMIF